MPMPNTSVPSVKFNGHTQFKRMKINCGVLRIFVDVSIHVMMLSMCEYVTMNPKRMGIHREEERITSIIK